MKRYLWPLIIILLISLLAPSYGSEIRKHDITGHWAEEAINKWRKNELMKGYPDGSFKPNANITKAEFIILINRIYGYYKKADENYRDVKDEDWYYDDISIAKANGYMNWYKEKELNPDQKITRQEVCAIIASIQQLQETKGLTKINRFNDKEKIPQWSKKYIDAVISMGYMKGYPDNTIKAKGNVTRAEVVTILNKVVGKLINKSGTYGTEDKLKIIEGNLTINTRGVNLKNTDINGSLILAAGIKEGDIDLQNVTVKGKIIINGGGENSITIKESNLKEIRIYKIDGKIRVVLSDSEVEGVILQSGGKLEGDYKDTPIRIDIEDEEKVILDGKFNSIIVDSEIDIQITNNSSIEELIFNAASTVTGKGKIARALLNVEGVKIQQKVEEIKLADGIEEEKVKKKSKSKSNSGKDKTAPSGYSVKINQKNINIINQYSVSFTISKAEINAVYNYSIDDTNKKTQAVEGRGKITAVDQEISGIDVSSLDDGILTLRVFLTDPSGNQGKQKTASASKNTTPSKDTTPPSGYNVSIDQLNINPNNARALSFKISGAEVGTTYKYTISSGGGGTEIKGSGKVSSSTEQITGIDVSGLKDGTLTVTVSLTDAAGNMGKYKTDIIRKNTTPSKDTTPPRGYSISIDQSNIDSSNVTDLSFKISGAEVGATYKYTISSSGGGTEIKGSGSISSSTEQITGIDVSGLKDGILTVTVALIDAAGNVGNNERATVNKDIGPPVGYDISINQNYINSANQNKMSFTFSGAEINADYNYSIDDTNTSTPSVEGSGKITKADQEVSGIDVSSLDDGTLTLIVYLTDKEGNKGIDVTKTVNKDTDKPRSYDISIDQNLITSTNQDKMSFAFSGAEINADYNYSIDDTNTSTQSVEGSGKIIKADQRISGIDVSSLDDGILTLTAYLIDVAGNEGEYKTVEVSKEATPPSGYSVSIDQSEINILEDTILSFEISGAEVGTNYEYTISSDGGGTDITGSGTISSSTEHITGIDVKDLANGELTLTFILTDQVGNKGNPAEDAVIKWNPYPDLKVTGCTFTGNNVNGTYVFDGLDCDINGDAQEDDRPTYKMGQCIIIWAYYEGEDPEWIWKIEKDDHIIYYNVQNTPKPPEDGWIDITRPNVNTQLRVIEKQ